MQKQRFEQLEGLRGIAAVIVVIYHFFLAFYLLAFFGPTLATAQHMRFEDNFFGNPLAVFLSGSFAVAIFFVLSGFVLSIGFFQSGSFDVIKKLATKRYLRLMIPALVSTIICFVLIFFSSSKVQEASAITQSGWLASQWQFTPDLFEAIQSGTYGIFIKEGSVYNNVLWTMHTEFIGSFIIFGFLMMFGKVKNRWLAYAMLLFLTFNTWYFAFVAGTILADLYANKKFVTKARSMTFIASLLLISLFFGGYPITGSENTVFYKIFTEMNGDVRWEVMLISAGAIGLLWLLLLSEQVAKVFSSKFVSGLGKYTFAMYLVHIPVIYTVGVTTFLLSYNVFGLTYNLSAIVAFIVYVPVVIGATLLFEKYVDSPAISLSSRFARAALDDRPLWSKEAFATGWQAFADRQRAAWRIFIGRRPLEEPEE